jgi:uncharacterized protein (TIGR00251 family)
MTSGAWVTRKAGAGATRVGAGSALTIDVKDGAVRFRVHVKPRAAKSRVLGPRAGALEVAVSAPPVDGKANAELVRILAETLGVGRRSVRVDSGQASRQKRVVVSGLAPEELVARLC